jgi:hypothetical protein
MSKPRNPATLEIPDKPLPDPFGEDSPAAQWARERPPVTVDLQDGGKPVVLATPAFNPDKGRPTKYAPALAAHIVELFRQGLTVPEVSRREGTPDTANLYRWLDNYPDFREAVSRARAAGAAAMADRAVDIADNADIENKVAVQRARLQVDARFRLAAVYDRRFSDRQIVTHEHAEPGQSLDMAGQDIATLAAQLGKLLAKAQAIDVTSEPIPSDMPALPKGKANT